MIYPLSFVSRLPCKPLRDALLSLFILGLAAARLFQRLAAYLGTLVTAAITLELLP